MLDNTIVLFTTDNGGASDYFDSNQGSNFPFRGIKTTLFEGGVRAAGFVYSHLVQKPKHISRQLIHVTDWFPTVLSLAGGNPDDTKHDGYNVWDSVSKGVATSRKEILLNIDDYIYQNAALREGRWKYVSQQPGEWSGWFNSPDYEREAYWNVERRKKFSKTTVKCDHKAPEPPDCTDGCLFDIKNDPCEYIDLSTKKPRTFKRLKDKLERYKSAMVQPRYNDTTDPRSDPQVNDGLWKPWVDLSDPDSTKESSSVSQTAANAASDLEDVDKILQGSFQSVESDTLSGQAPSDTSQPQASQQGSSPWPAYRPSPAYQPPPAYQPSPAYQQPSANYQQLPAYHQSQPVSMPSYSTMSYSMPLVDDRDDAVETLEPSNDQSNADSLAATPTSQYDDTDQLQEPNSASGQTPDQMVRIQLQSHPVSQGPSPKDRDDVGSTSELWNELSTLDQIATEAPPKNSDDIDHLQGSKSGTYQYHLPQNRSQMFLS